MSNGDPLQTGADELTSEAQHNTTTAAGRKRAKHITPTTAVGQTEGLYAADKAVGQARVLHATAEYCTGPLLETCMCPHSTAPHSSVHP